MISSTVEPHFMDNCLQCIIDRCVCPDKKFILFHISPINRDTGSYRQQTLFCDPSDMLSHQVNLALSTLVICTLYK